jgi:oxygen-independent coproporphyrinogen-3 oxidase
LESAVLALSFYLASLMIAREINSTMFNNIKGSVLSDLAVYIHIPFCEHKCIYCDFYSIINFENREAFLLALKREIRNYGERYRKGRKVRTVFFGGGTPSLLTPSEVGEILRTLFSNFDVAENLEITLETNPGTVDARKLKGFLEVGVNRLSVGVQSFDDEELKFLTRIHNSQDAERTVLDAEKVGFENIGIDLIFNLPGQTKKIWEENLRKAVALPVKHISAYSLILERGTILNKLVLDGKVKIQDEDYEADLYEFTMKFLHEHGFRHYEVSNFALPGFECLHNLFYWRYEEYLGFGPSAHSFVANKRWWNYSSLRKYIYEIEQKGNAERNSEALTEKQRTEEFVMLALRSEGLDLKRLRKEFSPDWEKRNKDYLEFLTKEHLIKFVRDKIVLTEKGFALCDEILLNFKN